MQKSANGKETMLFRLRFIERYKRVGGGKNRQNEGAKETVSGQDILGTKKTDYYPVKLVPTSYREKTEAVQASCSF
ncbi:hypothetical protein [Brevibacillus sp. NRS-1366]|uniref:hypothetical protein n=1 Tax=Brevibacillus sp. NRS-1366 TaxID=3233899 RepID=UPI003D1CB0F9